MPNELKPKIGVYWDNIPEKCYECPFINDGDDCILQSEEANEKAETWNDLQKGCPVKTIEDVREKAIIDFEERLLALFPCDKDITTVSKITIKRMATALAAKGLEQESKR